MKLICESCGAENVDLDEDGRCEDCADELAPPDEGVMCEFHSDLQAVGYVGDNPVCEYCMQSACGHD